MTVVFGLFITGFVSVLAVTLTLVDFSGNSIGRIARVWGWFFLKLSGIRVEIDGLEKLERGKSYVFISNHASLLDIPAVVYSLPFQLRFLAKKELYKIPVFGLALRMAGHIRIDRGNLESAVDSLKKASVRLKKRKASVLVFAEGTRSLDGEIGRFKKGGIILAISMGIPIVPISISGSRELAPKGAMMVKRGTIRLKVGNPIATEERDISERNELLQETRNEVIKNMVYESAAE